MCFSRYRLVFSMVFFPFVQARLAPQAMDMALEAGASREALDKALQKKAPEATFVGLQWGYGCGSKPMGSHFGVGAPPAFFCGDCDVHWGYGRDFDPVPYGILSELSETVSHHSVGYTPADSRFCFCTPELGQVLINMEPQN